MDDSSAEADLPAAPPPPALSMHHWLLVLPFIWQVGMVPFVNDVEARPLGLPFPMVWQMLGILVATVVIAAVARIDSRRSGGGDDGEGQ